LIAWNAIAEACRSAASPAIAATMCGRTPWVQPNAAKMPALEPRDRPAAMEYTAPVPGVATTTRMVSKKAMLIGQTSPFGRCSRTRY
jgi:hypothetical protein